MLSLSIDSLSNDPVKMGSNFFCCGTIHFPHVGMFSVSHRECIILQKGFLGNKMYVYFKLDIWRAFYCITLKDFNQS